MTKSEGPVPTMPRRVAPISACLLLLACTTDAQPRDVALRQMFHQAWGLREGAPGAITSIAQSADGYLWLASPAGLFRFDGVRFEKVRMVGPPVRRPSDLWALADGSLWVLHDRALLTRLLGHERTTFAAADGVPGSRTLSLGLDRAGVTWAAGEMGLARLNGTRWEMVVTAKTVLDPNGPSTAVLLDSRGALWASTGGQVLVRRPGQPAFALHSSFTSGCWPSRLTGSCGGYRSPEIPCARSRLQLVTPRKSPPSRMDGVWRSTATAVCTSPRDAASSI